MRRRFAAWCAVASLVGGCGSAASPSNNTTVLAMGTGSGFACAIPGSGSLYCWGVNDANQLARTDGEAQSHPAPVLTGPLSFTSVAGGNRLACGLLQDRSAACWGQGSSTITASATGLAFTELSVGQFACGLTDAGAVWCWNGPGATARQVQGTGFHSLAVGGSSACVLDAAGAALCWDQSTTSPTPVGGGLAFTYLARGDAHACGLTADGLAYCWGSNAYGQLGNRTRIDQADPVLVSRFAGDTQHFATIAAGSDFTCAIDSQGAGWCWGNDAFGQLGFGGEPPPPTLVFPLPVLMQSPEPLTSLSLGASHACGTGTDERLYCWGRNVDGAVGVGAGVAVVTLPTLVAWETEE